MGSVDSIGMRMAPRRSESYCFARFRLDHGWRDGGDSRSMIDPGHPDHDRRPPHGDAARHRLPTDASPPAVSVITACFNAGRLILETAACVLAQTLTSWEWIVVDDASTDEESIRALDALGKIDPRVRVIRSPGNGGPGAARNRGAAAACGSVLFFLDSDDLIEPTMLEHVAWHLATRPDVAATSTFEVGFGAQRYLWTQGFDTPEMLVQECPVGAHAAAVRADAFREAGGFDETIRGGMEDWDLWCRLASRGHWGTTIPEYLSWYRRREDHSARWEDWDGGERQERFRQRLKERYPGVFERPPRVLRTVEVPFASVGGDVPVRNSMAKGSPRLVVLTPRMTMSGADKQALNMIRLAQGRGWDVTVVAIEAGESWWQWEYSRLTTDVFRARSFVKACDVPRFVRGVIESRRPEVVALAGGELAYWLLPHMRAHCPEPAYVDVVHRVEEDWRNGGQPRHSAASRGMLDLTLSTSEAVRRWMVDRGGAADRIRVGVAHEDMEAWRRDEAIRSTVRREWSVPEGMPLILGVARWNESMRPATFAAALNRLAARGVAFRALVVGDGPARPTLERELGALIAQGVVRLAGAATNDRVRALCMASDVFLWTGVRTGASRAVHEAMAAGLAVVALDTPAQREVVKDGAGVLVDLGEGEADGLASALASLCGDERRCREAGRAARGAAVAAAADQGERLDAMLREAMEMRSRRGRFELDGATADEMAVRGVELARLQALADELWVENQRLREEGPRLVVHWPGLWPVTMGVLRRVMLEARLAWARALGRGGAG